ncbi:MAG: hypothetical protein A2428_16470 [Bdellovibrionales bacterium RIFOXYC1_FULL_54_43]|nr:MAG: hypothetical protein A2428_16470 [Bdellovibrionales bacterium RIFOXYC1_FULL_54_43]OFZ83939.1 MAG: hypothetical protein A2603_10325 [Bdellovibrionales bacterium RIFOXYD1_FULL_55_31]
MSSPRVGIVILSWNSPDQVHACLKSLKKLIYPEFSVLVLDNGSSPESRQRLKQDWPSEVELLEIAENLGFAGGVKHALSHLLMQGGRDYYLLLNDDAELSPEALTEMVKAMEENPKIGIAGPLIRAGSDSPTGFIAEGSVSLWTGGTPFSYVEPTAEVARCRMIHGCCFLIKHQVVDRVGLLDDSYFAYYEESDYCVRAARAGFELAVVKKARIFHEGGATMKKVSRLKEYLMLRNRLWFVRKNGNVFQFLSTLGFVVAVQIPRRALRLALSRRWDLLPILLLAIRDGLSAGGVELIRELQKPGIRKSPAA